MRIDAHVHYTPPALARDLPRFAAQEPYWGLLFGPNSIQGWATAGQMIEGMDSAGLDKVILVGEYFQKHENCVDRNSQAIEIVKRWPGRVVALATIQPKAGQQAIDELKRCLDNGLAGVGELNPYAQGYRLDDPDFLAIVELCLDYDLPLNLHANEEVGPYYPGKSTTPLAHYYRLACRYPALKLILAHWGGGLFFYEIMPRVKQMIKNVWYDTAASPLLYPTEKIFQIALSCLDHRKILYGSDYPLLIYPRRQQAPDFGLFIKEIESLNLAKNVYNKIMGLNAAQLFGLRAGIDQARAELKPPPKTAIDSQTALTESAAQETQVEYSPRLASDPVVGSMSVHMVAEAWPETRPIFEKFGIDWQDRPVPYWQPITQAAAASGWNPVDQQTLLDELNAVVTD